MACYCQAGYPEECSIDHSEQPLGIAPVASSLKTDDLVGDVKSTGRKRAILVKPIEKGITVCEWQGLASSGGGVFPIVGCIEGMANAIHHGPDKNTLNNKESNLHAICNTCHNRWHARNDPTYGEDNPGLEWLPTGNYIEHDPITLATPEDILKSEAYWQRNKR